jgi:hypothetical protein
MLKLVNEIGHDLQANCGDNETRFGLPFTRMACRQSRRLSMPPRPPKVIAVNPKTHQPIPPVIVRPAPGSKLTIQQLRDGDCKWPICETEDSPPYFYCGKPAPIGSSWCLKHQEIAYGKTLTYGTSTKPRPR